MPLIHFIKFEFWRLFSIDRQCLLAVKTDKSWFSALICLITLKKPKKFFCMFYSNSTSQKLKINSRICFWDGDRIAEQDRYKRCQVNKQLYSFIVIFFCYYYFYSQPYLFKSWSILFRRRDIIPWLLSCLLWIYCPLIKKNIKFDDLIQDLFKLKYKWLNGINLLSSSLDSSFFSSSSSCVNR